MTARNQYIIIRDDLLIDPLTIVTEGLLIGRLLECEVLLNHPSVSRVQAGIKQIEDDYYIFPLRPKNPVILNGKAVEDNEGLASGDIIEVGPFQLEIDITEEALILRVSMRIGMVASQVDVSDPRVSTDKLIAPSEEKTGKKPRPSPIAATKALDVFWDKRIREAGKMIRRSALFPKGQKRSGKSQFNWQPTTDLGTRWPVAFFIWAAVGVGFLSIAGAYWYASAYAPAPLSQAHAKSHFSILPAIAERPNSNSCTTCHSWKGSMDGRCVECHSTSAFAATVIKPHEAAGIGCVSCHSEHHGNEFSAKEGALDSCTSCHSDENQQIYNGRRVATPHGGSFGYPVVNGLWSLKSINDEEWDLRKIPIARLSSDSDEKWRSKQFHALHSERVRVVPGLTGHSAGQMSCSSCHKSFAPIDRTTPKTTCGICHNGKIEPLSNRVLVSNDKPNCTSCHVQHITDTRRWGKSMLVGQPSP